MALYDRSSVAGRYVDERVVEASFSAKPPKAKWRGELADGLQFSERTRHRGNVAYDLLAAFLVPKLSSLECRLIIVLCACVLLILVRLSRVYLGVHQFNDIVGAAAVGAALLLIWLIVMGLFLRR